MSDIETDIALMLPRDIPDASDLIAQSALSELSDDALVPGNLRELCDEFSALWTKMNDLLTRRMGHWEAGAHWPNILRANDKLFAAVLMIHEANRAYRNDDMYAGNLAYLDAEQWLQDADDELGNAEAICAENMRPPTLREQPAT